MTKIKVKQTEALNKKRILLSFGYTIQDETVVGDEVIFSVYKGEIANAKRLNYLEKHYKKTFKKFPIVSFIFFTLTLIATIVFGVLGINSNLTFLILFIISFIVLMISSFFLFCFILMKLRRKQIRKLILDETKKYCAVDDLDLTIDQNLTY